MLPFRRLSPLTEIDSDERDRVMSVNVRGVFECMKAVVPVMRAEGGGSIVNLSQQRQSKECREYCITSRRRVQ
jgi:NAD(P)-dependent dehydrogenase (short-subunit alcohol dehydrogenase family)